MPSTRIPSIDALRGLALGAILLANLPYPDAVVRPDGLDPALNTLFHLFIDRKFITVFSMLFGFGFYILMEKAETSGSDFRRYFAIRMVVLFVLACLHAYLLWFGDIIRAYAFGGLLLLFLYKRSVKSLVILALLFNILVTGIVYIGNSALEWQTYTYDVAIAGKLPMTTSYLEYLRFNFTIDPWINFLQDMPITLSFTFGNMLIGFLLGKMKFFQNPVAHRKMANWFVGLGLTVGLAASYVYTLIVSGKLELSLDLAWLPFVLIAGMLLQSLAYISLVIRLFEIRICRGFLNLFVPVGRLALSNYVLQSLFYHAVFFHCLPGLNLFGKLNLAQTYGVGILLFALQMALSFWWLRFFKQGPLERVWRNVVDKLTGKPQAFTTSTYKW
ncbi:MAG: DUF418 domain-containing protein [Saprospiraceae bacterium]|nr:DUF418 domain-containing protein [Saprospiraceae bacterium]